MKPTEETYSQLDRAYAHFNTALFDDQLPECIITLQRKKRTYGYFCGESWQTAKGDQITDEIALNPDHFEDREVRDVLSTLVHEMTHLQQHHFGKPSRKGYHNREWVGLMEAVGLTPSNTGQPGGKQTGQQMTHYINEGGRFDQTCAELLADGYGITWRARADDKLAAVKRASKTKYTCPSCDANAWAKPETKLICGECNEAFEAEDHD
jgi:predicted SprT family Zn-dependent metalloprotease